MNAGGRHIAYGHAAWRMGVVRQCVAVQIAPARGAEQRGVTVAPDQVFPWLRLRAIPIAGATHWPMNPRAEAPKCPPQCP